MQDRRVVVNGLMANALAQAGFGKYTIMNTDHGVVVRDEQGQVLCNVSITPSGLVRANTRTGALHAERKAVEAGVALANAKRNR